MKKTYMWVIALMLLIAVLAVPTFALVIYTVTLESNASTNAARTKLVVVNHNPENGYEYDTVLITNWPSALPQPHESYVHDYVQPGSTGGTHYSGWCNVLNADLDACYYTGWAN